MAVLPSLCTGRFAHLRSVTAFGPGLLVMLANCDAGNVVAAAQGGAQWGLRLAPILLGLIPLLYIVQELTVRLGSLTGLGHGELVRSELGRGWGWFSAVTLSIAVLSSLVTEFTGIAAVGEMIGVTRSVSLLLAVAFLLGVMFTGSHRRIDRLATIVGVFELSFFVVAWVAHPDLAQFGHALVDPPFSDPEFAYFAAALIGATFSPWMIFYQQAAVAERQLTWREYRAARVETAIGAVLTQLLTTAVLVAGANLTSDGAPHVFRSVGEISAALSGVLGARAGGVLFGAGVLGASMVASIVCLTALRSGLREVAGYRRSSEPQMGKARWPYVVCVIAALCTAYPVWLAPDLLWLNVAAQVVNALLLPLALGTLVTLCVKTLPREIGPRGFYLRGLVAMCAVVSIAAVAGAVSHLMA